MANYISVLEFQEGSDSARIQAAVNAASKDNCAVVIPANGGSANGVWEIDKAIELPSNAHILLDGAHLRLGCHHIVVENISGRTGDDTVALTGVFPVPEYVLPNKDEGGGGVTLERCLFKNVSYLPNSTEPRKVGYYEEPLPPTVFLFQNMKKQHHLDNVTVDSVTTKEGLPLLVLAKETKVRDIHISNIR